MVAARIAGDAKDDLEEPRARTVASVDELGEAPVSHDEDFLRAVFGVGLHHPEPAQVSPHEINVGVVHGPERALSRFVLGG